MLALLYPSVTFDLAFVLTITAVTVAMFALEWLPAGLVAMIAVAALMAAGVLSPEEAFQGFASSATVTVGAMFVLSAGVYHSGAVSRVGDLIANLLRRPLWVALIGISVIVGALSAFVNNTAVIAVLLPIVMAAARDTGTNSSKILIPMSFASMLGGVCTLIGTSTNLIVSQIAEDHDHEPIGMFEMAPLGLILAVAGVAFIVLIGGRLLPDRRGGSSASEDLRTARYIIDARLPTGSPSIGLRASRAPLLDDLDCELIDVLPRRDPGAAGDQVLQAGDVLRVRCTMDDIARLLDRDTVRVAPGDLDDDQLETHDAALVEAVIAPNSGLEGRRMGELEMPAEMGAVPLAVRHRGEVRRAGLDELFLNAGDVLLLLVQRDRVESLRRHRAFVLAAPTPLHHRRPGAEIISLAIVGGVVASATLGIMPIAASATIGAIIMIVCGCLRQDEATEAIDWNVIFLLGGLLGLAYALEQAGAVWLLATTLDETAGAFGPHVALATLYAASVILSAFVSNNGTAALLAPIALASAADLGVDSRPFLLAVAFGASTSFMTPVGYQTNTLVYGAGHYRFTDFLRIGAPLTLLIGSITVALLPLFYPF